jgi:hypothetical protein
MGRIVSIDNLVRGELTFTTNAYTNSMLALRTGMSPELHELVDGQTGNLIDLIVQEWFYATQQISTGNAHSRKVTFWHDGWVIDDEELLVWLACQGVGITATMVRGNDDAWGYESTLESGVLEKFAIPTKYITRESQSGDFETREIDTSPHLWRNTPDVLAAIDEFVNANPRVRDGLENGQHGRHVVEKRSGTQ